MAAFEDTLRAAAGWLDRTYGGLVVPADQQPIETTHAWLVASAYADPAAPGALLASTLAVPKDGGEPYPVSTADPFADTGADGWRWRVNARGCLIATDAAIGGHPASALPWRPEDERPGWWHRLLAQHFPDAEVAACATWDEVAAAVADGGPGTRGAVWLRRRVAGADVTGHLLTVQHVDGKAVVIDGQRGELARLDDAEVGELVLARYHRPTPTHAAPSQATPTQTTPPASLAAAPDFASAAAKATAWLDTAYGGAVTLVDPDETDETRRGWLFACATTRFLTTGDWRDQLLDAALVVPKAAGDEPFVLPNTDPWPWLLAWDDGAPDLPAPPTPSPPDWFATTVAATGQVLSTTTHRTWSDALAAVADLPAPAKALVWLRRTDDRGRETVGNLLVATRNGDDVHLVDAHGRTPAIEPEPLALHVIAIG